MGAMAQKMKILIVDDHAVVRAGACQLLAEIRNIETYEAATGHDALDAVNKQHPELVLLDLRLPDMSGLDVLNRLHALDALTKPRVIMFSMMADVPYAIRALRLGACGFISKSAGADQLLAAVKCVMDGEQYLERELADALAFMPRRQRPHPALWPREQSF